MLRGVYGFDHVPLGQDSAGGQLNNFSDLFAFDNQDAWASGAATGFSTGVMSDADGVWAVSASVSGSSRGIMIPVSAVQDLSTRASYMGFRFKATVGTIAASGILNITDGQAHSGNYLIPGVVRPNMWSLVLGTSYYVDVKFDRVNGLITVWVNNVQVSQVAYTPSTITAGCWLVMGLSATSEPNQYSYQFKDFYFVDDTQDGNLPNGRLGDTRAVPLTQASAVGTNWVSSDGAGLLADLNTPLTATASTWSAPVAQAPTPFTPLKVGLGTTIANGTPIRGVHLLASGLSSDSQPALDTALVDSSGHSISKGSIILPNANAQVGRSVGAFGSAADGGIWTPAKISASSLQLTPNQRKTALLMHFDGVNGQSNPAALADATGINTGSIVGATGLSTTQSKFGGSSLSTNVSAAYALINPHVSHQLLGDYTIEAWVFPLSIGDCVLCWKSNTIGGNTGRAWVELFTSKLYIKEDGTSGAVALGTATLVVNTWMHVAVVKSGSTLYGFFNGNLIGTLASSGTFGNSFNPLIIGNAYLNNGSQFPGYLDEFRISRFARWTASFTPPTVPYVVD